MTVEAVLYRERARYLRASGAKASEESRVLCEKIAEAYEALARNEEWLSGDAIAYVSVKSA